MQSFLKPRMSSLDTFRLSRQLCNCFVQEDVFSHLILIYATFLRNVFDLAFCRAHTVNHVYNIVLNFKAMFIFLGLNHYFWWLLALRSFYSVMQFKAFILLIDLLQDDDEADTVGCCTLKVENVKAVPPNTLEVLLCVCMCIF